MLEVPSGEPPPTPTPPPVVDLPFRAIGALIAFRFISDWTANEGLAIGDLVETRWVIILVAGVTIAGWLIAPFLSSRPGWVVMQHVRDHGPSQLLGGSVGLLIGVLAGAVIAATLPAFDEGILRWLPSFVTVGFGVLVAWVLGGSPAAGGILWQGVEQTLRRLTKRPVSLKKTSPATPRPAIERQTDRAA